MNLKCRLLSKLDFVSAELLTKEDQIVSATMRRQLQSKNPVNLKEAFPVDIWLESMIQNGLTTTTGTSNWAWLANGWAIRS